MSSLAGLTEGWGLCYKPTVPRGHGNRKERTMAFRIRHDLEAPADLILAIVSDWS